MTQTDEDKAHDLEAESPEPRELAAEEESAEAEVGDSEQQGSEAEPEVEVIEAEPPAPRTPTSPLSLAINQLLAEQNKVHDRLLRTAAEFENFKKRSRRDRAERVKQAEDHLVLEFLPVVDNLERALSHGGGDTDGALVDGVKMVHKQFLSVLERYGITPFDTLGQPFDPEFHEAVQQMHSEVETGAVCQELQRGYRREDRLVRAALVVVSKGPEEEPEEEPEDPRDLAETAEVQSVQDQAADQDAGEDPEENTGTAELEEGAAEGSKPQRAGDTEETAAPVMDMDAGEGQQGAEPEAEPEREA